MDPPCEALQDLMSESVSEQDGILMTIPKMSTEITQALPNPQFPSDSSIDTNGRIFTWDMRY
jgi:hypothetical protein